VVNETFARKFFGSVDALGHFVVNSLPKLAPAEIVGVVRDVKHMGVKERVWPVMYLPAMQADGPEGMLLVRSRWSASDAVSLVRAELKQADPSAPVESSRTLQTAVDSMISRERLIAWLSAAFGVLATLLAAVGLYGVMAYNMSRRTGEIGIRMALGARPEHIRKLALTEVLRLILAGILAGVPLALAAGRVIRGLLYGTSPVDPRVIGAAVFSMTAVALLAGWLPANRAARVDPNSALRHG